ncbi:PH domain-containing protein [Streptosporangium canum]|uniref:PH domain-containing protein n=1 Tax=Streptosporangium canum TaxID=324952 RepID=UPI0037AB7275
MTEQLRPDIQAALNLMQRKIGARREVRRLIEYLWEGERVDYMATGHYGGGQGLMVLTDRRLLFLKDGMLSKTTEDFPLEKISSVQWSSHVMAGTLIVFASGNKAEVKGMKKKDGKQIADAVRDRLSPGQQSVQAPFAHASNGGVIALLQQLGQLRDAGVVTAEEFEAKKAELLRRI